MFSNLQHNHYLHHAHYRNHHHHHSHTTHTHHTPCRYDLLHQSHVPVRGKSFIQPQPVPPLGRHDVAKPLKHRTSVDMILDLPVCHCPWLNVSQDSYHHDTGHSSLQLLDPGQMYQRTATILILDLPLCHCPCWTQA